MNKNILFGLMFVLMASFVFADTCSVGDINTNLSVTPCSVSSINKEYTYYFNLCNNYFKPVVLTTSNVMNGDVASEKISEIICSTSNLPNSSVSKTCSENLINSTIQKQKINSYSGTEIPSGSCKDYKYVLYTNKTDGKFDVNVLSYDKGFLVSNITLDPYYYNSSTVSKIVRYTFNESSINVNNTMGIANYSGISYGGVTNLSSPFGQCRAYDGTNGYSSLNFSGGAYSLANNNFTLAMIVNISDVNNGKGLFQIDNISVYSALLWQINGGSNALYLFGSTTGSSWQINGEITFSYTPNVWQCLVLNRENDLFRVFLNGVEVKNQTYSSYNFPTTTTNPRLGIEQASSYGKSKVDDFVLTNGYIFTRAEINTYCANATTPFSNTDLTPTIIFDKQIPNNVTISSVVATSINITYNYTVGLGSTLASEYLFYNVTTADLKPCIFTNGNISCSNRNITATSNSSNQLVYRLWDSLIIGGTYNYDERTLENTIHSNATIPDYLSLYLYNVSANRSFGFFEVMIHNTTTTASPQSIFYCNSSYTNGKPEVSSNCVQFGSIIPKPYDHNHSTYSSHYVVPFPIVNGSISGVGVSPESYFILDGGHGWNYHYITNFSRANGTRTSNNQGNTYTNLVGSLDAHLHQITGNDTLNYYACLTDSSAQSVCSSARSTTIGISALPPISPQIISPKNGTYNETIFINYTASSSTSGFITFYSIFIEDSSHNFVRNISTNNSLNLNFNFNSSLVGNGNYYILVTAWDNNSFSSTGESDLFTISNYIPPAPKTTAEAIDDFGNMFSFILLLLLSIVTYFLSFFRIGALNDARVKAGSFILKFFSIILVAGSYFYCADSTFKIILIAFMFLLVVSFIIELILAVVDELRH